MSRRLSVKMQLVFLATSVGMSMAHAADIEAGRTKVTTVCAACHGGNGVSVSANIPNLAGQKAGYVTGQLEAFRAGKRKNEIMNAIANQLSNEDIENVSAFFASLPGAPSSSVQSDLLPNVAKSRVNFPTHYKSSFTKYLTKEFPDTRQITYFYASPAAVKAAATGGPLPNGSFILDETFSAKLDEQQNAIKDSNGFLVPDELIGYGAMRKQAGWGAEIPDMLRNDDWNYASFTTDKLHRDGFNQAVCLACHKPQAQDSHLFTMKELREAAKALQPGQ
jgi:cytochrome c553